jgi:YHS domain-containing protein
MTDVADRFAVAGPELQEDPVCGMSVPADAPLRIEHEGKTYVFCAASCLQRFKDDPRAFAGRDHTERADDDNVKAR